MTKEDKQNEKPVHYEQKPDKDKPDYAPQRTYEEKSTDRRGFLKRTGTAVVVGLGGILFGKKALADGIDEIVGEEEGIKRVTDGYDDNNGQEYDEKLMCEPNPGCNPDCYPKICSPDKLCHPECGPHSEGNSDFKKVTGDYNRIGKDNSGGVYNCMPGGPCSPEYCQPCEPNCNPNCNPKDCHPECHPSCSPHSCNPN